MCHVMKVIKDHLFNSIKKTVLPNVNEFVQPKLYSIPGDKLIVITNITINPFTKKDIEIFVCG